MNISKSTAKVSFLCLNRELESACIFNQTCLCKSCKILQSQEVIYCFQDGLSHQGDKTMNEKRERST